MQQQLREPILLPWKFGLILLTIASGMLLVWNLPQLDFIAWLQTTASKGTIKILQFISDSITFFSLGVPLCLALRHEFKKQSDKSISRATFLYVGLSVALGGLVSYAIKNIGLVPRPYEVDPRILQWSVGGGFSFPSGHTTEAFAAATALTFLFPSWKFGLIFYSWAALVAFSRVYLGVHYPFDVLGGMGIGISAAYGLHFFFRAKTKIWV